LSEIELKIFRASSRLMAGMAFITGIWCYFNESLLNAFLLLGYFIVGIIFFLAYSWLMEGCGYE